MVLDFINGDSGGLRMGQMWRLGLLCVGLFVFASGLSGCVILSTSHLQQIREVEYLRGSADATSWCLQHVGKRN